MQPRIPISRTEKKQSKPQRKGMQPTVKTKFESSLQTVQKGKGARREVPKKGTASQSKAAQPPPDPSRAAIIEISKEMKTRPNELQKLHRRWMEIEEPNPVIFIEPNVFGTEDDIVMLVSCQDVALLLTRGWLDHSLITVFMM